MAKKSMIERQTKRVRLVQKHKTKRFNIKQEMRQTDSLSQKLALSLKLQNFPRNSSATRLTNRCLVTGRPKGYYRDFGLSRHVLREMGHQCLLPGLRKSSW